MSEISQRLKSVTQGAPTQEFTLRRNQMGQLGFHVQHDGLITEVENFGYAWQTGLRQGSRLVEVDVILYRNLFISHLSIGNQTYFVFILLFNAELKKLSKFSDHDLMAKLQA